MKLNLIVFLIISLFSHCSPRSERVVSEGVPTVYFELDDFDLNRNLTAYFPDSSLNYFKATRLKLIDSLLIIKDGANYNNYFHIYNKHNLKSIVSFGKAGNGPKELTGPSTVYMKDSVLSVLDMTGGQNKQYAIIKLLSNGIEEIVNSYFFGNVMGETVYNLIPYGSGYIKQTSQWNRLSHLNEEFKTISEFAPYSEVEDFGLSETDNIYKNLRNYAHGTWGNSDIINGNLVLIYQKMGLIEVFNIDTQKVVLKIVGPFPSEFPPKIVYDSYNDVYSPQKETSRSSYYRIQTTDSSIFVLYSGEKLTKMPTGSGKKIFQFDWLGNPISQFELDIEIYDFQFDDNEQKFYALSSEETDNMLIVFPLNN